MQALVFHHPKKVSVDTVNDPKIEKQDVWGRFCISA